jgi:hypothetical protein
MVCGECAAVSGARRAGGFVVHIVGPLPLREVRHGPGDCLALSAVVVGQVGEPDLAVLKTAGLNQLC